MSDFHEALGFVALTEPLSDAEMDLLESRLSGLSRFPPQATNYRGETVITASGDKAAVALGRVAQSNNLPTGITDRLANFSADRTDLSEREEIIRGLARQWFVGAPDLPSMIGSRLAASRADANRRSLEIEVATAAVINLPSSKRAAILPRLIDAWRTEQEPAQRIALAKVIGSIHVD